MGREIGFDVYTKNVDDSGVEYIQRLELLNADNWVCGRSEITDGWGTYFGFDYKTDEAVVPVFSNAFDRWKCDGYSNKRFSASGNGPTSLAFVSYEEFATEAKREALECLKMSEKESELNKTSLDNLNRVYREVLDKIVNESDPVKSERLKEQSEMILDKIATVTEQCRYANDDYFADQSKRVIELLEKMNQYMNLGFIVIPYFSD